jgi:hypothetical protein
MLKKARKLDPEAFFWKRDKMSAIVFPNLKANISFENGLKPVITFGSVIDTERQKVIENALGIKAWNGKN